MTVSPTARLIGNENVSEEVLIQVLTEILSVEEPSKTLEHTKGGKGKKHIQTPAEASDPADFDFLRQGSLVYPHRTPLHLFCSNSELISAEIVKVLLDAAGDAANIRDRSSDGNGEGYLPLHSVMLREDSMELSADALTAIFMEMQTACPPCVIAKAPSGLNMLHLVYQRVDLTPALVASVTSPMQELAELQCSDTDSRGNTPLHQLCAHQSVDDVLLQQAIAMTSSTVLSDGDNAPTQYRFGANKSGKRPLHLLCSNTTIAPSLLGMLATADVGSLHAQDTSGSTPMHVLVQRRDIAPDVLTSLLEAMCTSGSGEGLDFSWLELKDAAQNTALHLLMRRAGVNGPCITALLQYHPQLASIQDEKQRTALHCYCAVPRKKDAEDRPFNQSAIDLQTLKTFLALASTAGISSGDTDHADALDAIASMAKFNLVHELDERGLDTDGDPELLVARLSQAVTAENTAAAAEASKAHLRLADANGRTSLHTLCRRTDLSAEELCPLIKRLASAGPAAAEMKDCPCDEFARSYRDGYSLHDRTPLHHVLDREERVQDGKEQVMHLTVKLVRTLIDASPASVAVVDIWGRSALHVWVSRQDVSPILQESIVEMMVKANPKILMSLDSFCEGAVHTLCAHPSISPSMIRLVLEANPYIAALRDLRGMTPLMALCANRVVTEAHITAWLSAIADTLLDEEQDLQEKCLGAPTWLAAQHETFLHRMFDTRIDVDKSGSVTVNELIDLLREDTYLWNLLVSKCRFPSDEEYSVEFDDAISKLFDSIDTNGDTTVSLDEFLAHFSSMHDATQQMVMITELDKGSDSDFEAEDGDLTDIKTPQEPNLRLADVKHKVSADPDATESLTARSATTFRRLAMLMSSTELMTPGRSKSRDASDSVLAIAPTNMVLVVNTTKPFPAKLRRRILESGRTTQDFSHVDMLDPEGRSALHFLVSFNGGTMKCDELANAIDALARVAPSAVAAQTKSEPQLTPLQACLYRTDINATLLRSLVDHNAQAAGICDQHGWLPLHVLCSRSDLLDKTNAERLEKIIEVLVTAYPVAVRRPLPPALLTDRVINCTVVHKMCASRHSAQCVLPLLVACPDAAQIADSNVRLFNAPDHEFHLAKSSAIMQDNTPLHYLCKNRFLCAGLGVVKDVEPRPELPNAAAAVAQPSKTRPLARSAGGRPGTFGTSPRSGRGSVDLERKMQAERTPRRKKPTRRSTQKNRRVSLKKVASASSSPPSTSLPATLMAPSRIVISTLAVEKHVSRVFEKLVEAFPAAIAAGNMYGTTPVHYAAANPTLPAALLEAVLSCMVSFPEGRSALMLQANATVQTGVDEYTQGMPHQTPAHIIAGREDVTPELMLLTSEAAQGKAPSCQQNAHGETPFHMLCSPERRVDFFSRHSASLDDWKRLFTLMHTSVTAGMRGPLGMLNKDGLSPMHMLATQEKLRDEEITIMVLQEMVSASFESIALQDAKTKSTVLHMICASNSPTFLAQGIRAVLSTGRTLQEGAVACLCDMDGRNPLHVLLENPYCTSSVLRSFLTNFGDGDLCTAMETVDSQGRLPLHVLAASCCTSDVLTSLLQQLKHYITAETVALQDAKELSALHYTIDMVDAVAFEILASKNPDGVCTVADGSGLTCLHRACSSFTLKPFLIAAIMQHCSESAMLSTDEGLTALHMLARRDSRTMAAERLECVQAITAKCAEAVAIQVQNRTGQSQQRWPDNTVVHDVCAAPFVDEQFLSALLGPAPKAGEVINLAGYTPLQVLIQRTDLRDDLERLVEHFTELSPNSVRVGGCDKAGRALDSIPKRFNSMPTAFHMLCERKDATVGLVKALGRGAHQAAMVQDAAGRVPLHVMCMREDLIEMEDHVALTRAVAEANPDAACVRALYDKGLNRGVVPNATPAHVLCCRPRLSAALLRAVFDTCPSAASVADMDRLVMHAVHKGVVDQTIVGELPIHRLLTNTQCQVTADMLEVIGEASAELINKPSELFGEGNSMHLLAKRVDVTVGGLHTLSQHCQIAVTGRDSIGMTPLHRLCLNASVRLDTLQLLGDLEPASVKVADHHGMTPLHVLLEGPETITAEAMTPMAEALTRLNPLGLLVPDKTGRTALHILTEGSRITLNGCRSMAETGGANSIGLQDARGATPIHNCASSRHVTLPMLQALVMERPEALAIQDEGGATVLHRLIENKHLLKRPEREFTAILQFVVQSCPSAVGLKNKITNKGKLVDHQTAVSALCERPILTVEFLTVLLIARRSAAHVADARKCRPWTAISRRPDLSVDGKISLRNELEKY